MKKKYRAELRSLRANVEWLHKRERMLFERTENLINLLNDIRREIAANPGSTEETTKSFRECLLALRTQNLMLRKRIDKLENPDMKPGELRPHMGEDWDQWPST